MFWDVCQFHMYFRKYREILCSLYIGIKLNDSNDKVLISLKKREGSSFQLNVIGKSSATKCHMEISKAATAHISRWTLYAS